MSTPYRFHPLESHPYSGPEPADLASPPPQQPPPPPQWEPHPSYPGEKTPATSFVTTTAAVSADDDRASAKWTAASNYTYDSSQAAGLMADGGGGERDQTGDGAAAAEVQASYLERKRRRFAPTWAIALLTLGTAAATVFYSARVMLDKAALPASLEHGPGTTVLVVNVLSHLVAFLCLTLFVETMEALRWALACRRGGFLLTSFLAMSRATPLMGVLYLCRVRGSHQFWAMQRFLSYIADVVLSLVLITNVTFKTVYNPFTHDRGAATQEVVAGLAPVSGYGLTNISLSLVPILATSYSMGFLTDPRFVAKVEPIQCSGPHCLSVFLPGGMDSVRFYTKEGSHTLLNGDFPGEWDTIVINGAPGYQIEYGSVAEYDPNFQFNTAKGGDCTMYLKTMDDGLFVCQRQIGNEMIVGWSICPEKIFNAKKCQTDLSWTDTIFWNTTVAMFSRRATVAYDKQNISIISVESISEPVQIPSESEDFALYCAVIMGPITPAVNYTSNPATYGFSSTVFTFGYGIGFILRLYRSDMSTYLDGGQSLLRSFVAVPFQFSTIMRQFGGIDQMPPDNHVVASLSRASYRAFIDPWTVFVFAVLSFLLTAWCLAALAWISFVGPYAPNMSFFPEINITSKSSLHTQPDLRAEMDPHLEVADATLEDLGTLTRSYGLGNGRSRDVIESIRGKRVYCGSMAGQAQGERVIVLVTEGGRLKLLNEHERYS